MHKLTNINISTKQAICSSCGPVKIKINSNRYCQCRNYVNENLRKYRLKRIQEMPELIKAQERKRKERQRNLVKACLKDSCDICGSKQKLCFDHDHKKFDGIVTTREHLKYYRGTLCNDCNLGIAHFKDNINLLNKAIQYLQLTKSI